MPSQPIAETPDPEPTGSDETFAQPTATAELDDVDDAPADDGSVPVSASAHVNAWPYSADDSAQPAASASNRYAGVASSAGTELVPARPRIRSGAIVWGVLVMAFAATAGAIAGFEPVRYAFESWAASLTPGGLLVIGVVAVGVLVLLIAGLSTIRSAQRRAAQA